MGDASVNLGQLNDEDKRFRTFDNHAFSFDKRDLAKAGFYYTRQESIVKCFDCPLEFNAQEIDPTSSIVQYHKDKSPECSFASQLPSPETMRRSKQFISYDSLRYERARLETFIDWPVNWLKPEDLASDGFYYLRTQDHCACVFCRGIVGAWENGDTPRGEHQRHFPHCPFIRGQPVGNIPIVHSQILSKLSPNTPVPEPPGAAFSTDICGTPRLMSGSHPESCGPSKKESPNFQSLGCPQFSEPKRKDFLTFESRQASYSRWPDRVTQKPQELAEAGFFYCGLSDHVRCFHCGNGLRNWETDDQPWNEHARWYPDCTFVRLTKGQEFIDKVRRERPPYIRSQATNKGASTSATPVKQTISESELEPLMELDIIRAVMAMGFPQDKVRAALRRKLEQTGLPFFSLEPCIEAILQYMEEETRQTLQARASQQIEDEAREQQANRLLAAGDSVTRPSTTTSTSTSTSVSVTSPPVSTSTTTTTTPSSSGVSTSSASGPSTSGADTTTTSVSSPALQTSTSTVEEIMEVDELTTPAASTMAAAESSSQPMDIITQADEVIVMAEEALKPTTSGPPSLNQEEKSEEGQAAKEKLSEEPSTSSSQKKKSAAASAQSTEALAEQLEKIRDSRMCKVCMDADMDVVFLPCQHMVTCSSCAVAMSLCPICREAIKFYIKPILS